MNNKAILLTLSFVTLATILYSTAFLVSYHDNEVEQGISQMAALDNINNKNVYLSNCLRDISKNSNASKIIFNNNSIRFEINNNNITNLRDNMNNLKGMLKLLDNSTMFSADLPSDLDMSILPYSIGYSQTYSTGKVTIEVSNNSKAININVKLLKNFTGVWTWNNFTPGNLNLSVYISGNNTNSYSNRSINLFGYNHLNISTQIGTISIISQEGSVIIENGAKEGTLSTTIYLNSTLDTSMVMPSAYTVRSHGTEFTGDAQIAENS